MKKTGFTLVELLASIILVGVIIGITVVGYDRYIEKSEKNSFKESLNSLIKIIEIYIVENPDVNYKNYINIKDIELEAENIDIINSGKFRYKYNKVELVDIESDYFCGNGYKNDLIITDGKC